MSRVRNLSLSQARRIALAAQGFYDPPGTRITPRHVKRVIDRVQIVQIDSVNVVSRSHYLPFYSRLGPYDRALLDGMRDRMTARPGVVPLVEYWAHEASLIPVTSWPYLSFRMRSERWLTEGHALAVQHPGLVEAVREMIHAHGGMTARQVEAALPSGGAKRTGHWGWNWSAVKQCLEHLFAVGSISSSGRTAQFERLYAPLEAVLPPDVIAQGPGAPGQLSERECAEHLMLLSARAHGVGTEACLRDYFRLRPAVARAALASLVQQRQVQPVTISGWNRQAFLSPDARVPRQSRGTALLSPFDSLVWQRDRVEHLFNFRYRLEIYTPKRHRVYGYYVLPFLFNGELVARVDVKAERTSGTLMVHAIAYEPSAPSEAAESLVESLDDLAFWLGLDTVSLP